MDEMKLARLVHDVANAMCSRGEMWTLSGTAKRGFGVDMHSKDGERVNFQQDKDSIRLVIEGIDPLTAYSVAKPIRVTASRHPLVIAREIANRLLPDYRAELAERREKEAARLAAFNARAAAVNAVEALFGEPTDFGTLEPNATGERNYKTEARLALRGKSLKEVWRGSNIYEHEFARVEVTGDGSLMNVSLKDIPAAVVMRMMRVLADYNAMWPADSPRDDEADGTPEPKPFSAEFERLYDEYVAAGARGSWTDWLKSRAV